jgi:hypothetical protein
MSSTSANGHTSCPALQHAQRMYKIVWMGGPYTSSDMMRYLIKISTSNFASGEEHALQTFLNDPGFLKRVSQGQLERDNERGELAHLYKRRTGLCTSFALNVTRLLNKTRPAMFNFGFYDSGRHRFARCKNTGIVIDSSTGHPFTLKKDEQKEVCEIGFSKVGKSIKYQPRSRSVRGRTLS